MIASKVECKPNPLALPIKMIWVAIFMIAIFETVTPWVASRWTLYVDPMGEESCIPEYSVYYQNKGFDGAITKDRIYTFKSESLEPFFPDGLTIGKYVSGVEGDVVTITKDGLFINNIKIRSGINAEVAKKLGKQPSDFYTSYEIKEGQVFVTGTAERSYDSRYWGTISSNRIDSEAVPLW
jgi:conjugal transfer pilin signal peptidase TrbI